MSVTINTFQGLVSAYRHHVAKKQAAQYLARVNDRVLDDIGVARGDVFK